MLILETDKLDNKGSKFYANGYLCPGSSHHQVKPDETKPKVKKMGYAAKAAAASRSASNSTTAQPAPSAAVASSNVTVSSSSDTNNSSSSQQSHSLFNLNVDTEVYEDDQNGDFAPLWGLRGWPAVFCYPQHEPPLQHWPNIVSLIMDNRYVLERQGGKGSVVHTERRLKTSYYITSVDPTVFLVLLLEGKRRPSEKTVQVGDISWLGKERANDWELKSMVDFVGFHADHGRESPAQWCVPTRRLGRRCLQ
jgi:hypothetical protein